MTLILTECLPYNFLLWEGFLRRYFKKTWYYGKPVLCACKAVASVNQFLKVLGKYWLKYLQIRM